MTMHTLRTHRHKTATLRYTANYRLSMTLTTATTTQSTTAVRYNRLCKSITSDLMLLTTHPNHLRR